MSHHSQTQSRHLESRPAADSSVQPADIDQFVQAATEAGWGSLAEIGRGLSQRSEDIGGALQKVDTALAVQLGDEYVGPAIDSAAYVLEGMWRRDGMPGDDGSPFHVDTIRARCQEAGLPAYLPGLVHSVADRETVTRSYLNGLDADRLGVVQDAVQGLVDALASRLRQIGADQP